MTLSAKTDRRGLFSAAALRVLALTAMLLDHLWATLIPGSMWMTWVGRLAFPIFAFQLSEGFVHSHDRRAYGKRLLLFALISEVPFDLVYGGTALYPFHQNVMWTLLLGLLAMAAVERGRARGTKKALVIGGLQAAGLCLVGVVTFVDYGGWGVATALGFYLFRNFPGARLCQLALLTYINGFAYMGMTIPVTVLGHVFDFPTQGFAILALVPIWLYNGRKGGGGKALQWGCYVFYPAHLLVLWLLFTLR